MPDVLFVLIFMLLHFVVPLVIAVIIVNYIFGDVTWHTVLTNPYYGSCVILVFFCVRWCLIIFIHLFVMPLSVTPLREPPPPSTFLR